MSSYTNTAYQPHSLDSAPNTTPGGSSLDSVEFPNVGCVMVVLLDHRTAPTPPVAFPWETDDGRSAVYKHGGFVAPEPTPERRYTPAPESTSDGFDATWQSLGRALSRMNQPSYEDEMARWSSLVSSIPGYWSRFESLTPTPVVDRLAVIDNTPTGHPPPIVRPPRPASPTAVDSTLLGEDAAGTVGSILGFTGTNNLTVNVGGASAASSTPTARSHMQGIPAGTTTLPPMGGRHPWDPDIPNEDEFQTHRDEGNNPVRRYRDEWGKWHNLPPQPDYSLLQTFAAGAAGHPRPKPVIPWAQQNRLRPRR